jgi:hypothetical protein
MANDNEAMIGGNTTTTSGTGDTSVRVVVFTGKRDKWETKRYKFMVKAAIRGFESVLLGDDVVPKTRL